MKCPVCDQAGLVHDFRDKPYTHEGVTAVIPNVEADWCAACREGPVENIARAAE
ncbi:type II toxin-antitoxin system MqsA family antitoxin [Pseudomonas sp. Q1-7]|uniref:type II toxin-antitoxin system MqsA family antitoxin n=1 Tax=Pseudomonas sp. Q1-7 TaxID=3020843 RepID=UPI002301EAEB|nr:type II toxin-antitoxin system MqsA family antitoxin [Pseudomonas sp. Q1-7]